MTTRPADLRQLASRIFDETLRDADAGLAVRRAITCDGARLKIFDAEFDARALDVYAVALGKAAGPMAAALDEILGARILGGVVSAPPLKSPLSQRWQVFEGGHPLPNRASIEAARAAFSLLRRANEGAINDAVGDRNADGDGARRTLVVFLVSGGGSAMLESPRDPSITLGDLRDLNLALVTCGAPVSEINAVRRAVSAVKGGGLALAASRAAQVTLIVSDVRAGEEHAVASGPTFPADAARDALTARAVVARYDLSARLPASVLRAIESSGYQGSATDEEGLAAGRRHLVMLDNERAVERAAEVARAEGFAVEVARDIADQNVEEGARLLVMRLLELKERIGAGRGVCVVSGGEFACPVRGAGTGGRNSETALRCAVELSRQFNTIDAAPRFVALCAGTDGIDGNSPAAGALCDERTNARAQALGLDARASLERSDSHTFFAALGDAIDTGPTGTNVRDLRILLAK